MADMARWLVMRVLVRIAPDGEDRGASLVEYALLVALIALVCVAAVTFLGQNTNSSYSQIATAFTGS